MDKIIPRRISASLLTLLFALFVTAALNGNFWTDLSGAAGGFKLANLPLLLGAFAIVALFFNGVLTLVSFPYVVRPVLIVMLLSAAAASYFIGQYGVVIDKAMIQNVFETDTREAMELLNFKMIGFVALLGLVPSWLIARTEIDFTPGIKGLMRRGGIAAGSTAVAVVLLMLLFKSLAPVLREHRELRYLLTPTNTISAVSGYLRARWSGPLVVAPLGRDAVKGAFWAGKRRRTVTVIVVGETARAQNFSLNAYARDTNPRLAREPGLINFSHVSSCGTATAVSLPCVFSALDRDHYDGAKAIRQEGLLDVMSHAGLRVLWRDNNSGCKGTCDRVATTDVSVPTPGDPLCAGDECYDERLLAGLPELIRNSDRDLVIVLHQKGSHGPAYARRVPAGFGKFGPVCETSEFQKCERQTIVNAYDNTILYTDYLLAKTIDMLRTVADQGGRDTAMLYFSDHGESLGENNVYLHGAPYMFAPAEQTRVPMMLWMSDGFSDRFGIDRRCLAARSKQAFSHDNVFHSVLGMLDLNTAVLNPKLDIFHACKRSA